MRQLPQPRPTWRPLCWRGKGAASRGRCASRRLTAGLHCSFKASAPAPNDQLPRCAEQRAEYGPAHTATPRLRPLRSPATAALPASPSHVPPRSRDVGQQAALTFVSAVGSCCGRWRRPCAWRTCFLRCASDYGAHEHARTLCASPPGPSRRRVHEEGGGGCLGTHGGHCAHCECTSAALEPIIRGGASPLRPALDGVHPGAAAVRPAKLWRWRLERGDTLGRPCRGGGGGSSCGAAAPLHALLPPALLQHADGGAMLHPTGTSGFDGLGACTAGETPAKLAR